MIKKISVVTLIVALFLGSGYGLYRYGVSVGVDNYHEMCYNGPPGLIIDEKTGTVVLCQGLKIDAPQVVPQRDLGNRNDI